MKHRVTGIGGFFFKTKDPDQIKSWYKTHLGLNTDRYGCTFWWKDKEGNELLLKTIVGSNLYRDQKKSVRFKRPDFDEMMEERLLHHIEDDDNSGNEHEEDFRMLPSPPIHYNRPLPINVHLIV